MHCDYVLLRLFHDYHARRRRRRRFFLRIKHTKNVSRIMNKYIPTISERGPDGEMVEAIVRARDFRTRACCL